MTSFSLEPIRGCITQERYIKGKTLKELEDILGYKAGFLERGMRVVALLRLPRIDEFELLGYSQVAEHRVSKAGQSGLDINKIKEIVLRDTFTLVGSKRLVKVIPTVKPVLSGDNDKDFPPGAGVPQWLIKRTCSIPGIVLAEVLPGEVYK